MVFASAEAWLDQFPVLLHRSGSPRGSGPHLDPGCCTIFFLKT